MELEPGTGWYGEHVPRTLSRGRSSELVHPDGIWTALPGTPGGGDYAAVPAKSGEAGSSGLGCGLLRVVWEPVPSLKLVCPSGRHNSNHPKACPMHVAGGVRESSERDVPYSKSSLEETGRVSPQPTQEETEA